MAPHSAPAANPFAALSAGRVRSARTVPKTRTPANPGGCGRRSGTLSRIRTVPSGVALVADQFESRLGRPRAGVARGSVKVGARDLDQVRARAFR